MVTKDTPSLPDFTYYDPIKYDYSTVAASRTYRELNTPGENKFTIGLPYGDTFTGKQVMDWLCIGSERESCVTDMKWMNVQSFEGYPRPGYLGLCADPAGIDYGVVAPEPVADSYIKKLKEA